jgi:uncharacterized protein YidB (DUF937 family)
MGLLDVIQGMENGPHGSRSGAAGGGQTKSGLSPMTMAVLGLLAYKAFKHLTSAPAAAPAGPASGTATAPGGSGLGDLLKGGLGGLGGILGGADAGNIVSGGLNDLLKQFQQGGQGDVAKSWIGTGANKAISPQDLEKVLDSDQLKTLMAQTGLSRQDLLAGLSQVLPDVVDQLSPDGRVPTGQELSRSM